MNKRMNIAYNKEQSKTEWAHSEDQNKVATLTFSESK